MEEQRSARIRRLASCLKRRRVFGAMWRTGSVGSSFPLARRLVRAAASRTKAAEITPG